MATNLINLQSADIYGQISPDAVPLMSKIEKYKLYDNLGATWDIPLQLFIVPGGHKTSITFCNEIHAALPSVIADRFYYASSIQKCWKCRRPSQVHSIFTKFCGIM